MLYVGKTITRIDSLEKVTGRSVYGVDFSLPHMLFGKFKRSDVPHAEILTIDTSRASKVSGVRAILTGNDLPDTLFGAGLSDMPIMARTRVRYVGEPVAAVAADTPESAAEAVDLIEVAYKEIPAVFDPEESLKENPPAILHPDLMSYKVTPKLPPVRDPKLPNVGNHVKVRKGDVESAFKSADKIIENRFSTNLVQHVHTEPNATVAQVENDGSVTVWTSTQSVYRARYMLSEALELPVSRVRVISTEVGGGFGNKLEFGCFRSRCSPAIKSDWQASEDSIDTRRSFFRDHNQASLCHLREGWCDERRSDWSRDKLGQSWMVVRILAVPGSLSEGILFSVP